MRIPLKRNSLPGSQIRLSLKPCFREDSILGNLLEIQGRLSLTGYGIYFSGLLEGKEAFVISERAHVCFPILLLCFSTSPLNPFLIRHTGARMYFCEQCSFLLRREDGKELASFFLQDKAGRASRSNRDMATPLTHSSAL